MKIDYSTASSVQHGGSHYTKNKIQVWDFITDNGLDYLEGNVVKYISRYKEKNGLEDLKKARHYIDKIIEVRYTRTVACPPQKDLGQE